MSAQLKRIFDLDKVTFQAPNIGTGEDVNDWGEQEVIFIEIISADTSVNDGSVNAIVKGHIRFFGSAEKIPYGYFAKQISKADPADTKPFFFHNFENNKGTIDDICERTLDFVYLFDSQYNPDVGTITSITF